MESTYKPHPSKPFLLTFLSRCGWECFTNARIPHLEPFPDPGHWPPLAHFYRGSMTLGTPNAGGQNSY